MLLHSHDYRNYTLWETDEDPVRLFTPPWRLKTILLAPAVGHGHSFRHFGRLRNVLFVKIRVYFALDDSFAHFTPNESVYEERTRFNVELNQSISQSLPW